MCLWQSQCWAQHPRLWGKYLKNSIPLALIPAPSHPLLRAGHPEGFGGTRPGWEVPAPLWWVLSCSRRGSGAVPAICRARANYSPELAGFKGLCWCRLGWRGRARLQLGVGSARSLACASGSAQPPLLHRALCPSLRLQEVNPPWLCRDSLPAG